MCLRDCWRFIWSDIFESPIIISFNRTNSVQPCVDATNETDNIYDYLFTISINVSTNIQKWMLYTVVFRFQNGMPLCKMAFLLGLKGTQKTDYQRQDT